MDFEVASAQASLATKVFSCPLIFRRCGRGGLNWRRKTEKGAVELLKEKKLHQSAFVIALPRLNCRKLLPTTLGTELIKQLKAYHLASL